MSKRAISLSRHREKIEQTKKALLADGLEPDLLIVYEYKPGGAHEWQEIAAAEFYDDEATPGLYRTTVKPAQDEDPLEATAIESIQLANASDDEREPNMLRAVNAAAHSQLTSLQSELARKANALEKADERAEAANARAYQFQDLAEERQRRIAALEQELARANGRIEALEERLDDDTDLDGLSEAAFAALWPRIKPAVEHFTGVSFDDLDEARARANAATQVIVEAVRKADATQVTALLGPGVNDAVKLLGPGDGDHGH